jgi:hypothetical protein
MGKLHNVTLQLILFAEGANGQCVKVRRVNDTVEVRDSKDRSGPTPRFAVSDL